MSSDAVPLLTLVPLAADSAVSFGDSPEALAVGFGDSPEARAGERCSGGGAKLQQDNEEHIRTPADAYEAYFEVAWRNLRRLGITHAMVEDAVQDVFLVVHRRWDDFRHHSTVRTWVIGICLLVARDYRRKRLRAAQNQELESNDAISMETPVATVERVEATRILMTLLDGLDEQCRTVFVLVELEELSMTEAAEAIGIPVSTAYKRLANARRQFERAIIRKKAHEGWRFGWNR